MPGLPHPPDADRADHPLADAEQVIEALNDAIAHDGTPRDKAERMLASFQRLVGYDADVELVLQTDITRDPAPRIVDRLCVGPTFDRIEPRGDAEVQALLDHSAPAIRRIIPDVLETLRTPHVFLVSRDFRDRGWFEAMRDRFLRPHGWQDMIVSDWATGKDRMVGLAVMQRDGTPPLDDVTERLTSLMLRALAPIVVREMFDNVGEGDGEAGDEGRGLLGGRELSKRQTDVLHQLLRGMSEKEVARELGVSTHTVHTHVKRLYTEFEVSSRGELLAKFVDRRALRQTT